MRIAVSQRVDILPDRNERRDALDQRLCVLLIRAGLTPTPMPNALDPAACGTWLGAVQPRGVVLSGGNDVGQIRERDATETLLLDFAKARHLPVLGICRGMQMLAKYAGGDLAPVTGHVRTRHELTGADAREVNSFHDWGLTDCPPGYSITARSEDGGIEAIRHTTLPWRGWMWHPEREAIFAERDLADMRELFGVKAAL